MEKTFYDQQDPQIGSDESYPHIMKVTNFDGIMNIIENIGQWRSQSNAII